MRIAADSLRLLTYFRGEEQRKILDRPLWLIYSRTMSHVRVAFKQVDTLVTGLFGDYWWAWLGCFVGASAIHVGTALLRLDSFFPVLQALDFSSYYAGAWSVRLHESPYYWSESLLKFLAETQNLVQTPPVHNSPPLWPMLLQPLTALSFPTAATLWLSILLLIAGICHVLLLRTAGYADWKVILVMLPFTVTFGPLFLNLTLGQNGLFLLPAALLLGEVLRQKRPISFELLSVAAWVVAVGAKVYPLLWIGCLPLVKRWRLFAIAVVLCLVVFGITTLLQPEISAEYWFTFLPGRTGQFSAQVSIDDQSLVGFLSRVGQSNRFSFPGLSVQDKHEVTWDFPWDFSAQSMQTASIILIFLMGGWLVFSWVRGDREEPDGFLYAVVLFSLLLLPHMARYNHVLVLPAMAWLWRRGTGYRKAVIIAYALFGLSRLNHLWVILLPAPIGPAASGFGLFGVIVLMFGISYAISRSSSLSEKK